MPTKGIKDPFSGNTVAVFPSAGDYGIKESWPVVITVESNEGPISVQYNADRTCYAKFASKHNQFGQSGKGRPSITNAKRQAVALVTRFLAIKGVN